MATRELVVPASLARVSSRNAYELRRRELGAFLRSRRERIRPEQVGLPPSRRRRTPGLRREEVAQLAGVGVTWYTWLEQGRDINPSAQVLDAIARTMQFDADEHAHLFTLAGVPYTSIAHECQTLAPNMQLLLDQLEPFPACIVNARYDLLAFNGVYASAFDGLDTMPIEDRNALWLVFTDAGWREVILDWDEVVRRMVAEYRAAMAEHIDEPAWKSLIARLHRASPEFTAVWERHDVEGAQNRAKRILHPAVGLLLLEDTNLWCGQRLGARVVAFTPADDETRKRLEKLHHSLAASAAADAA